MQQDSQSSSSSAAAAIAPSGSNGSSLFNPDEVRFMDDSLSNADSFDPFTIGAPGFKVPNVLPANLGGIGSIPRGLSLGGNVSSNQGTTSWMERGDRMQSDNTHTQQQQQQQLHQRRQSNSHAPSPLPNSIRGGYGRDKAWQMQQLEALQAERERYQSHQRQLGLSEDGTSSMPDFTHAERTGQSLNGLEGDLLWMRGSPNEQLQNGQSNQDGMMQATMQNYNQRTPMTNIPNSSSQNLSLLGLNFPSSHQFPAAPRDEDTPSKRQRRVTGEDSTGMDCEEVDARGSRRGRSPNPRPPWSQPPNLSNIPPGHVNVNDGASMSLSSSSSGYLNQSGQTSTTKPEPSRGPVQRDGLQKAALTIDMEAPYTFLPAPKPPPKLVNLSKAEGRSSAIPSHLCESFFSPTLARYQPHLILLRQEQMNRKERGLSANIRKGDKKVNVKHEGSPDGMDGDNEKKKAGHTLLTEAEKKANHIASEQKRRANIRKGYEMLCDLVPSLREEEEGEEGEEEKGVIGMEDDGEEDEEARKGKRRRGYETSGGGERIEGRTGPRSEAAILMAAVEHLRGQLEIHRDLLIKKQEAQLRVAQRYGLDVKAEGSVRDTK